MWKCENGHNNVLRPLVMNINPMICGKCMMEALAKRQANNPKPQQAKA